MEASRVKIDWNAVFTFEDGAGKRQAISAVLTDRPTSRRVGRKQYPGGFAEITAYVANDRLTLSLECECFPLAHVSLRTDARGPQEILGYANRAFYWLIELAELNHGSANGSDGAQEPAPEATKK